MGIFDLRCGLFRLYCRVASHINYIYSPLQMHLKITLIRSLGMEKWNHDKRKLCAPLINNDKTTEVLLLHANHLNASKPVTNRDAWQSYNGLSTQTSCSMAAWKNCSNNFHGKICLHPFTSLIGTPVISEANLS